MIFERLHKDELSIALNNSDTSVLFTSTRRRFAIRQAEEEFIDLTECLIVQSTVACSCNVTEYALTTSTGGSSNFLRVAKQGVEYHLTSSNDTLRTVSGDQFPRRDIHWLNTNRPNWRESTTPAEFPAEYYIRADSSRLLIGLTEPPDIGSSETGTLLIPFVSRGEALSSGSEPFNGRLDLRYYHKALPEYAAYKLKTLFGDSQGAQESLQKFMGYVERYKQDQRPKGGTHVTSARRYFGEARRVGLEPDRSIDPRFGTRV
jgi:hypothetical protein